MHQKHEQQTREDVKTKDQEIKFNPEVMYSVVKKPKKSKSRYTTLM